MLHYVVRPRIPRNFGIVAAALGDPVFFLSFSKFFLLGVRTISVSQFSSIEEQYHTLLVETIVLYFSSLFFLGHHRLALPTKALLRRATKHIGYLAAELTWLPVLLSSY